MKGERVRGSGLGSYLDCNRIELMIMMRGQISFHRLNNVVGSDPDSVSPGNHHCPTTRGRKKDATSREGQTNQITNPPFTICITCSSSSSSHRQWKCMSHHSTRQFHGYVPAICKPIIDTAALLLLLLLLLHVINTCLHLVSVL